MLTSMIEDLSSEIAATPQPGGGRRRPPTTASEAAAAPERCLLLADRAVSAASGGFDQVDASDVDHRATAESAVLAGLLRYDRRRVARLGQRSDRRQAELDVQARQLPTTVRPAAHRDAARPRSFGPILRRSA